MNLDKHEVLALTPIWHSCRAMLFYMKKHLAQQEVSHDSSVSTQGLSIRGFDFEVKFRIEHPDFPLKFHPKR